ncbi:TPA: hypothetical protein L7J05_003904 [Klebsiella pneumoniae]|nr:hypothetical protein [Klebsiella pneumoniae]HBV9108112.1 hypothetical protein [Klebsiella pneumoniae]
MKERGIIFNGESEIWKPVVGYEGRYEVSNFGNIRSLSNYRKGLFHNNIAHFIQNKGYHYVSIRDASGKSKRLAVHRIVLEAFVGPRPDGKQMRTGMATLLITGSRISAGLHPKKTLQIVHATDVRQ